MKRLVRPWPIVAAVTLAYMIAIVLRSHGDPLSLAMLGTRFSEGDPAGSEGYDGQFAYYIARDPLDGCSRCDVPAYRLQRVLYPILARALALGWEPAIPFTLALLNVMALAAGTWLTEEILARYKMSRWYALTYGLYAGQLMAARLDLNEPLAYALVQAALLLLERDRWKSGVACFALAALAKETTLVFVAGYLLVLLARRQWGRLAGLSLGAGVPFAAWQVILKVWLGDWGVGSGGAGATGWEVLPFRGLWSVGAIDLKALAILALVMVPLAIIPTLLSLWTAGRDLWRGRWHPFTAILLANALVMLFLPQSTYREFLGMLRMTTGLVAATILYGAGRRSKRTLNYTLLWLTSLVFLTKDVPAP